MLCYQPDHAVRSSPISAWAQVYHTVQVKGLQCEQAALQQLLDLVTSTEADEHGAH